MICGARTWVDPGHFVSCVRTDCDGQHRDSGMMRWNEASVAMRCDDGRMAYPTETEARALVASLQAQLDALDPDAAIAEAERRAVEMFHHYRGLCGLADRRRYIVGASCSSLELIDAAKERASEEHDAALETWLALVEARGAKGGGA